MAGWQLNHQNVINYPCTSFFIFLQSCHVIAIATNFCICLFCFGNPELGGGFRELFIVIPYIHVPRSPMPSIFEGQALFEAKQGVYGCFRK